MQADIDLPEVYNLGSTGFAECLRNHEMRIENTADGPLMVRFVRWRSRKWLKKIGEGFVDVQIVSYVIIDVLSTDVYVSASEANGGHL